MRRVVLALLVWACLGVAGQAQTPAPAPTLTAAPTGALVFPALTGRVVDEAGLLTPADRAQLTASLAGLEARTKDQLVVVTLKSLQGRPIEDYCYQLGRAWQIGQKGQDSGALLIVAPTERRVRIEVGYGLEGTLTDAATKLIIENTILPAFKTGNYASGIKDGAGQIIQLLGGDAAPGITPNAGAPPAPNTPIWPIILIGVFGAGLLIYCAISGGAACQGIMQILFVVALSGRGGSSGGGSQSFSGGGGSFGGGGSSGSW